MAQKLSDVQLNEFRELYGGVVKYPENHARAHIQLLFGHIEALEAEQKAINVGLGINIEQLGQVIQRNADRIKELEDFVKKMAGIVHHAENSHHVSTNWATSQIAEALGQLNANGQG